MPPRSAGIRNSSPGSGSLSRLRNLSTRRSRSRAVRQSRVAQAFFPLPLGERDRVRGPVQLSNHESRITSHQSPVTSHDVTPAASGVEALVANLERVVVGKRPELELAVAVLLAGGHLLLQDVPGVGKTVLARALPAIERRDAGMTPAKPTS